MKVKHLGIIPDGNRRWASQMGVSNLYAYSLFTEHICNIIHALNDTNINMLTVYVVSKDNLERNNQDVSDVLQSVNNMLVEKMPPIIQELQAQVRCIGIDAIDDEEICKNAKKLEMSSRFNSGIVVNLLIGYNPIDEINEAIKKHGLISIDVLSVPKCVDLLIRTAGGPTRLSNFLPLQCGYASIEMLDDKFLDVSCDRIVSIIKKYKDIEPKYGK